jgi:hypothetical protein
MGQIITHIHSNIDQLFLANRRRRVYELQYEHWVYLVYPSYMTKTWLFWILYIDEFFLTS